MHATLCLNGSANRSRTEQGTMGLGELLFPFRCYGNVGKRFSAHTVVENIVLCATKSTIATLLDKGQRCAGLNGCKKLG